jgi:uridine kinase
VVIGLAGGTGSGKTTLAHALAACRGGCVIQLDSYYLDRSTLLPEERGRVNYDEPGAIEIGLLLRHLGRLAAGEPVRKPVYSFQCHSRVGEEVVSPASLIVVDGLFSLWWAELRGLLDVRVYVDAPADLRLARRIRRDVTERGRQVESVLAQYLTTVRPMHERYVEPTKAHADLVVVNDGRLEDCVAQVEAAVRGCLVRVAGR